MIVVIADDFSGAAEIAGIAWRYGLNVGLQTDIDLSVKYDIVIIDANSRSKNEKEARRIHKSLARYLCKFQIKFVYKKIDSALRGHIIAETESLLDDLHIDKVLIAANNPSTGRTIKNGQYYIAGQLLHETDFKSDPEFPVNSSFVLEILGSSDKLSLLYLGKSDAISRSGFFIPEITNSDDLSFRASGINEMILPVGGSDFFKALLEVNGHKMIYKKDQTELKRNKTRLFILASPAEQNRNYIEKIQKSGIPVCNFPCLAADLSNLSMDCLDKWLNNITKAFEKCHWVACTIQQPLNREPGFPEALNKFVSKMVKAVLNSRELNELVITGGATASNLTQYLGWKNFTPTFEYATGVVELKIENQPECKMIVKPGSYTWPDHFLRGIL